MARRLDVAFATLLAAILAIAARRFPAVPSLLFPAPAALHERAHTAFALGIWCFGVAAVVSIARGWVPNGEIATQFRKSTAAVVGLNMAFLLTVLAGLAPLLSANDPIAIDVGPHAVSPRFAFPFGTDDFGRDLLCRCLYGARISLSIGFIAVSISATLGTVVGAVSGFAGGWVDRGLMWFTDLLLALPRLVLLLAIVGLYRGSGAQNLIVIVVILGLTGWMGVARIVRAQILSLREQDFVLAARALGLPPARILFRHLVPNSLAPVIVYGSLALGGTMLTEAALSFLGLGVPPPTPTWGVMVNEGRLQMRSAPWITILPGLCIVAAVMSFNLIGDGLRDALDPRLRGRKS